MDNLEGLWFGVFWLNKPALSDGAKGSSYLLIQSMDLLGAWTVTTWGGRQSCLDGGIWIWAAQKLTEWAFAVPITYERSSLSSPILQCFSAAWTMINMWVENHWTGVIKWLLVSWSSFYMVEGSCISVSQSVLFPRIFLLFHVCKLGCFISLSLDSSVFKKSIVTLLHVHLKPEGKCLIFWHQDTEARQGLGRVRFVCVFQ